MTTLAEYDVFLSYNHRDREAVLEIWHALEARGLRSFIDIASLPKGRPWIPRLEEGIRCSRAAIVFVGPHGPGPFQEAEIQLAVVRQWQRVSDADSFVVVPALLRQADLDGFSAFLKLNTFISFQDGVNETSLDELAKSLQPSRHPTAVRENRLEICPYLGLETFREEHAKFFFGRESYIDALVTQLRPGRLVALVGASGSGKSSVIHAGVLPRLNQEGAADRWNILKMTPDAKPFRSLASAVLSEIQPELMGLDRLQAVDALEPRLRDPNAPTAYSWKELSAEFTRSGDAGSHALLVIDQFEEIFSLTPATDRRPFLETILSALRARVAVVLTMRADYIGPATSETREFTDILQQGLMLLGPMRREELARAVVEPARAVGLTVDPVLVERLLNDIGEDTGTLLPLLEFAIKELWRKRNGDTMTAESYAGVEEFTKAIAARADEEVALLKVPNRYEVARRVLCRLVQVSPTTDEGSDTRARLPTATLTNDEKEVVLCLSRARLLTTNRDPASGISTVEVAHEALIRHWPRLRAWIEQDHAFLLWRQRFNFFREEWLRLQRASENLLPDAMLKEARQFERARPLEFDARESEYIASSSLVQSKTSRWRRGVAAVAAVGLLMAVGWWFWTRTSAYQVRQAYLKGHRSAAAVTNTGALGEWLAALLLAGQQARAENMLKERDSKTRYPIVIAAIEHLKSANTNVPAALYGWALEWAPRSEIRFGFGNSTSDLVRQEVTSTVLDTRGAQYLIELLRRNSELGVRCIVAADAIQLALKPARSVHARELIRFGLSLIAQSSTLSVESPSRCPNLLRTLIEAGQIQEVLEALKSAGPRIYDAEIATVSEALAGIGKVDEALALIPESKNGDSVIQQATRISVLTSAAAVLFRDGNPSAAIKRTHEVRDIARAVSDRSAKDQLLETAADELIELDFSLASVLALEIGDSDMRDQQLSTIAVKAADSDCRVAFALADRIRVSDDRMSAQGDVFEGCAARGKLEEGFSALSRRLGPVMLLAAIQDAPADLVSAGRDDAAVAVTRRRRAMAASLSPQDRRALRIDENAVEVLLDTGNSAEAIAIVRESRSKTLNEVLEAAVPDAARRLATKTRVGDALSLIELVAQPLVQAEALTAVLTAKRSTTSSRTMNSAGTAGVQTEATDALAREMAIRARRLAEEAERDTAVPRDRLERVFAQLASLPPLSSNGVTSALELARKINDANLRERTLVTVLTEAAKARLVDVAIANADAVKDSKLQFQALMQILRAGITQQNMSVAMGSASKAVKLVSRGVDSRECGDLGAAFAELGEFYDAMRTSDQCGDTADRLRGYASIVRFSTPPSKPILAQRR